MIVTITSWAPVRAFRMPGMNPPMAPPTAPAITTSGMWMMAGRCHWNPTYVAAIAPAISCPWPPMLNTPVEKPTATPMPARISGVADTMVSEIGVKVLFQPVPVEMECDRAAGLMIDPSKRAAYDCDTVDQLWAKAWPGWEPIWPQA